MICRIHTDEGLYGDGEAAPCYGNAAPGVYGQLAEFASLIIGLDPLDNEVIWDKLYRQTFWGQNGGPMVFAAISALDIACWDIRGKYFNVPVYKLLGGKKRDKIRAYACQLQLGWGNNEDAHVLAYKAEEYAANAKKAVDEGYDAVKIDFFNHDGDGTARSSPSRRLGF